MSTPPLAEFVRQLLIDNDLGVDGVSDTADWGVYVGREPEKPDNVITVYRTAGTLQGRLHNTGGIVEHYGLLIRVRGRSYPTAETKIQEITDNLDEEVKDQSVSVSHQDGTFVRTIHSFTRTSSVIPLGVDESNGSRDLFTVNYTFTFN